MSETICVTLPDDIIASLDAWIAGEDGPKPSREAAISHAVCDWLAALGHVPPERCSISTEDENQPASSRS